ncbi:VOC family protein [Solirubrobacter soli]|uniref:VOC family protein n=1 Tax=Solirubrobacter soli TaxID=363832 RepID=UPI00041112F5|nr:VOC family protein [Solirubrobacter soli]
MSASVHHVGLQVSDLDRAGAFYAAALGARWMVMPLAFEGPGAVQAMGHEGVKLRLAMLAVGDAMLELFEFTGDEVPDWARRARDARLPHLAVLVEDTDATLTRVEAAGGKRIWPEVDRFGRARVIYVQDPDGNVVELLDKPPADIAAALLRWFPEATP